MFAAFIKQPGFFSFCDTAHDLINETTTYPVTDGTSLWMLGLCIGNDTACNVDPDTRQEYDYSGIPLTPFTPIPADNAGNTTYNITFLYCNPQASIRTREITTQNGVLNVGATDLPISQGNLQPWQVQLLLGISMSPLLGLGPVINGPPGPLSNLGPAAQTLMLVGKDVYNSVPPDGYKFGDANTPSSFTIKPQAIPILIQSYLALLRSFSKLYLEGGLGKSYVPGRVTKNVGLISSSLPHVIVSTILMLILGVFGIAAHFRAKVPQFTFVDVARSMAGSDVPKRVVVESDPERELGEKTLKVSHRAILGDEERRAIPIFSLS